MSKAKVSISASLLACLAALALCGCSTFNYEWRQAAKKPAPTNQITGRWEGHWTSEESGHNDRLRALITQVDTNHYQVRFRADYKKWITFHFAYTVLMQTQAASNEVAFHGSEDLGALAGGIYTYEGHANPINFFSTYKSKYDHGVFRMERPIP